MSKTDQVYRLELFKEGKSLDGESCHTPLIQALRRVKQVNLSEFQSSKLCSEMGVGRKRERKRGEKGELENKQASIGEVWEHIWAISSTDYH